MPANLQQKPRIDVFSGFNFTCEKLSSLEYAIRLKTQKSSTLSASSNHDNVAVYPGGRIRGDPRTLLAIFNSGYLCDDAVPIL